MSGKNLSNSKLYHLFAMVVIMGMLVSACGEEPTPVAPTQPVTTPPTNTPPPTATPRPTTTPTEIPIILPTATPPQPQLPPTRPVFQEPFTPAATSTANPPTAFPPTIPPSATPYIPPVIVPLSIVQRPIFNYSELDLILPPSFSTQCIQAQYLPGNSPTPIPTATPVPPGVIIVNPPVPTPIPTKIGNATPSGINGRLSSTAYNTWALSFQTRWLNNGRLNQTLIPSPTYTPVPTTVPTTPQFPPTPTPLPFPTNDVFTGLTARPTERIPASPTNTPRPPTPTIAPSPTPLLVQKYDVQSNVIGGGEIASYWITDVTAALPLYTNEPINFVAMWYVMNDLTLAMVNIDTPLENHLRAYEQTLDQILQRVLSFNLNDLNVTSRIGARFANRRVILGNVPDLRAFRFFKPCFTDEKIRTVQNAYNQVINRVAAKYPGRVFIADLSTLPWLSNPQWVTVQNGYELSPSGAEAVADAFGKVFAKLTF